MSAPLLLRPHHGLCIAHFTGKGYSPAFTTNMTNVISSLHAHPEQKIRLHMGMDVLCACCPHNLDGQRCRSQEKVARYDARSLSLCGVKDGTELPWRTFEQLIQTNILNAGQMRTVCAGCAWLRLCESVSASTYVLSV